MEEFERIYFEQVYDRYVATLYRIAYCYTGNRPDAEDMVTDTFLKLFSCRVDFQSMEHEKAWLVRVCINLCKNRRREFWRRSVCALPEQLPTEGGGEDLSYVAESLNALPRKQLTAVYLYYYEGYSSREIAGFFHMTESGVRTLLKRARDCLKGILESEE